MFVHIFTGDTVFAQGAAATPVHLLTAMTEKGKCAQLQDIKVFHMHTEGKAAYTAEDCEGIFRYYTAHSYSHTYRMLRN